jgi:hypothetical protein
VAVLTEKHPSGERADRAHQPRRQLENANGKSHHVERSEDATAPSATSGQARYSGARRFAKFVARLLKLNRERYAEEVNKGLHEKKRPKATNGKKSRG